MSKVKEYIRDYIDWCDWKIEYPISGTERLYIGFLVGLMLFPLLFPLFAIYKWSHEEAIKDTKG